MSPPPPPPPIVAAPRSLRSLAAVAVEGRHDALRPSAARHHPRQERDDGHARRRGACRARRIFLFAPDGGVPDSIDASVPRRALLERDRRRPRARTDRGLRAGLRSSDRAWSTRCPTARRRRCRSRSSARSRSSKSASTTSSASASRRSRTASSRSSATPVTQTKYRIRNGGDHAAKVLVTPPAAERRAPLPAAEGHRGQRRHRQRARAHAASRPRSTAELIVDERRPTRRREDWFTVVADNAVKAYLADPRADRNIASKLTAAWSFRDADRRRSARLAQKLAQEQVDLSQTRPRRRARTCAPSRRTRPPTRFARSSRRASPRYRRASTR